MIKLITSRQNAFVKQLYQLSHTSDSYYKYQQILLEGEHLCRTYQEKSGPPLAVVFSKSGYENPNLSSLVDLNCDVYILDDAVFKSISSLQSVTGIAFLIEHQLSNQIKPDISTVILDRLQDPGNIGTILRSASAFGFKQIIAMKNTGALWSSKVLRAGMGAHFSLQIHEHCEICDIQKLQIPIFGTSSHARESIQKTKIQMPCAWVIGHEGQGVKEDLLKRCSQVMKIEQPGGEESLNAAVACSICLYASTH